MQAKAQEQFHCGRWHHGPVLAVVDTTTYEYVLPAALDLARSGARALAVCTYLPSTWSEAAQHLSPVCLPAPGYGVDERLDDMHDLQVKIGRSLPRDISVRVVGATGEGRSTLTRVVRHSGARLVVMAGDRNRLRTLLRVRVWRKVSVLLVTRDAVAPIGEVLAAGADHEAWAAIGVNEGATR